MDMDMDASDVEVDDNEAEELQMYEAHDEDEDKMDETVEESVKPKATYAKTAVDLMREYVEKVAMPSGEDNKAVSPVAGKNDMGGKAVDFDAGSTTDPDGTSAPKEGKVDKMPHAGNYQNVPGAKANLSKATGAKNTQEPGVNTKAVQGDK